MDLSIVILSFNTKELTLNCIKSIIENTKNVNYEIIVVDNGSTDGSVKEILRLKHQTSSKEIKVIENKRNLGFAKANNQGMRKSRGNYISLLNSDTLITNNIFKEMIHWMDVNPKVGISTCTLRGSDGALQGNGGYFPTLVRVFSWMFFLDDIPFLDFVIKPFHPLHRESPFYKGEGFSLSERQIDWVTGAFMLIRGSVIKEVGYLDEDYFMYTEDTDFCFRVKKAGWEIWYLPNWSLIHLGGASSTKEFPIVSEFEGIKLFYKKNMSFWKFSLLRVFLKLGALLRILIFSLIKGPSVGKIYVKAFNIA